ncbi:MAG: hypothetical protein PHY56_00465 [Candidatus Omnitrophica bacterium]|nr:hypothetical protein [Candidatus Omnitrophota bacterium]
MQTHPPTKKQLNVFVLGVVLLLLFFSWKIYKTTGHKISILFIGIALLLVIIYLIKKSFVIQFYNIWMKCASLIGIAVTTILMLCIFYLVFAPVGILLRMLKKDVLSLKKDARLKTYWIDKPQVKFNKEDYGRQF